MKRKITAEQITEWFTIGTQFANIRITEEVRKEAKTDEETKDNGPVGSDSLQGNLKSSASDGADRTREAKTEARGSTSPPLLANYQYPELPITKNRQELISLIENNSVVIIRGPTGSGKTTQLPQFILDYYSERDAPCNLVVTQPRKIGASSIARWVACERRCTLGSLVGYQVGLEKVATEHTRLTYVTTGVLLQKLVGAKSLTEYSHIFIDEVHERSEELDLLLLVVRKLLHSNSRYVKVILMSATIDCKEFAEYFGTPVNRQVNPAYVFQVEGQPYAIEEFYLDDLRSLLPLMIPLSEEPCITMEMYNVAVGLIQNFDELESKDQSSRSNKEGLSFPERGSVLVFLPGLAEIQHMQDALSKLVRKRLQVYPLHSTFTLEEQNGVFLVPVPGYRKIILSTNIAESSVTVPDVKYVIDFCLARHLVCDKETNFQSLHLNWASKTNCNQRRGRAGRVSKGYCYRLVTKEFWKNEIPDFVVPEMLRSPLASTMLKVKLLDMGDPRSVLSAALSPPNLDHIERTVLQLKELGALSLNQNAQTCFDGELTFLGRVLAHLPLDLHLGKMIVLGHVFGCLEETLIIAASLSLKSFFAMPSLQRFTGYRSKLSFAGGTPSDSIAFLNAFKTWYTSRNKGELRFPKEELEWGKENCVQIKRIREVAELFEDLKKRLAQFNMHVSDKASTPSDYGSLHKQRFILQIVIAGAFYPNYFTLGEIDEEMASKELSGHDPKTTVLLRNIPPYGFLYYKQLPSLFRQCGQVKSISFDGSRAYVEFYRTSIRETGVLPEVSLALLMSHHRNSLDLFVHPTDEVEAKAGGKTLSPLRYARVNVDFQNHSVYPVGVLSSTIDPDKLPSNQVFVVNVTEVLEVGHFWGYQADESSLEKQQRLTAEINSQQLRPVSGSLYPNLLCLAPFAETEETSQYFRAKVLHVLGSSVEVFFVDYGNTSLVNSSCLRDLPADLLVQPFQAQEFQIAGMRPSAHSMILGEQWSFSARNRFITLVNSRSLIVSLFSILHGVLRVDLHVNTDTSSSSVTHIMVKEGYAQKAEESFESKQSHEILQTLYQDLQDGTFISNATSSSWKVRKVEEKQLIDCLLEGFSKTSLSSLKCKVPLHGPASPHRINFHSMSNIGQYRSVTIDKDSINCVAVNDNPQDCHQRMLVAGSVFVSASGSNILLKETTILPNIHGLPALVCMLFTPVMELRTNEERTCFTGALCGLGWNSHTQEPILPEHDIELAFDVKFDTDDITEINALRGTINRLACEGPGGSLHLGPDRVTRLQQEIRDRLVRLFTKSPPREDLTPQYYEKQKLWNQVDPTQKMELLQKDDWKSKGVLFQLHPVTLLNM